LLRLIDILNLQISKLRKQSLSESYCP